MDPEMVEHGASPEMVCFCFDILIAALKNRTSPRVPAAIPNDKFPLFVTWKIGRSKRLRGCIGTFSHLKLHEGLAEYALTSAINDSRFNPISLEEVPQLHCSVSLLIKFEPATNYFDWIVGIHGIRINYHAGHRQYSAVYLPEVAPEQGWDHLETIDSLIRKGGYNGPIDEPFRLAVHVTRFQSSKTLLSYQEYESLKKSR